MSDRGDIIDVITRMFVGTDNRDWHAVRACFASHVHFDMTSLAGGAPAILSPHEITDGWEKGLAPIRAVHHQIGNFIIDIAVSAVEAGVSCYGIAYHYLPENPGRKTRVFVGSYDLHLVKAHTEWMIDRFRYNSKFIEEE